MQSMWALLSDFEKTKKTKDLFNKEYCEKKQVIQRKNLDKVNDFV